MKPTTTTSLPASRRHILDLLKQRGDATAGEVAEQLGMTRENARQQLQLLEQEGWIARSERAAPGARQPITAAGRPPVVFRITPAGEIGRAHV